MKALPANVKQLITKVARLMREGGTQGEMLSAKAALERIAAKHGLTIQEMGVLDPRQIRLLPIPKTDIYLRTIILLIVKRHCPDCELRDTQEMHFDKKQNLDYTLHEGLFNPTEYELLRELISDYATSWQRYQNDAFVSWVNVQGILPENPEAARQQGHSEEDAQRINRIRAMAKTVDKVKPNPHKKLK